VRSQNCSPSKQNYSKSATWRIDILSPARLALVNSVPKATIPSDFTLVWHWQQIYHSVLVNASNTQITNYQYTESVAARRVECVLQRLQRECLRTTVWLSVSSSGFRESDWEPRCGWVCPPAVSERMLENHGILLLLSLCSFSSAVFFIASNLSSSSSSALIPSINFDVVWNPVPVASGLWLFNGETGRTVASFANYTCKNTQLISTVVAVIA